MIAMTRATLPFAKQNAQPHILDHDIAIIGNSQRRLAGRIALTPAVNLADYRFRAVIDWIEFKLHLGKSTQAQHVQAVLRRFLNRDSHIIAENKGPGDVFSICTIKVQEPISLALISQIHKALSNTFGEAAESRVTGLEVSIDATPREPSDAARALLLGAMQRTIWTKRDIWSNRNSRPRTVFGKGEKANLTLSPEPEKGDTDLSGSVPENHRIPAIDGTMYLGAKDDDDVMIRLMDKVVDSQRPDGTFISLEDDRKRVRVEVRLKGKELEKVGITDIQSLGRLNFTKFQKRYFQFALPTFSKRAKPKTGADIIHNVRQDWRVKTYLRSGVVGLMAMDAVLARHRKAMKPRMQKVLRQMNLARSRVWVGTRLAAPVVSWAALNRKVNVALRDLMKRETTAKSRAVGA